MIDSNSTHSPAQAAPSEIDRLRRQARQRFIGAGVLLLAAVVSLPFVLDSKPRPVSPNITIDIPKSAPTAPPQAIPVVASQPALETPAPAVSAAPVALEAAPLAPTAPNPTETPSPAAALLEGQAPATGYAIQAGSYTDKAKLQEVEAKLDKAGLAHYTQGAISKNGTHHTRVRLGPFATQQEANAAAVKVNKLGLKTIVIKP